MMNTHVLTQATAIGAMSFALVVALVDRPHGAAIGTSHVLAADASAWPASIEAGADHITASALSERLLADPRSVLLIDVRPADEFATFHLPGAVNLDLTELLGARGDELLAAHSGSLVVLCSNGMTHPAQAWVELTRRGRTDVRVLEDGLDGFVRDVLTPPSLRGATTEARAARESAAFAAASAAFLARPAVATSSVPALDNTARNSVQAPVPAPTAAQKPDAKKPEAPPFARLATDPDALTKPAIVSTAWVARRDAKFVILDAREKPEDYAAGHIPGAQHLPIKSLREERDGVPDQLLAPEKLAALFGRLGIDAETSVVTYADVKMQDAAHAALALISAGHQKVAILEGGFLAWKAEGRAVSTDVPAVAAKNYVTRPSPGFHSVALKDVMKASAGSDLRLLDVRPADAFRGDVSTEARRGHIPHSINRPYTSDISSSEAGLFWRPVDDLRREYEAFGFDPKQPVIVTCRTGHQAAQTWFTLRYILGYEDVSWYDGSWNEWAAHAELPVALGPAEK
jgi:3-mercaptopyruvate sulfurtransferase SseA